ncbi:MAG: protein kinase, partial [Myxococcaceae bacterium]|nr:protein kinase [Myxococcaceae bacterium]
MSETLLCPHCAKLLSGEPNFCPACGTDLRGLSPTSATQSGPMSGALIGGRYQVLEKLGEGGMGAVFKVEHVRMGKILALKLLRPDAARDKSITARFQQEARVVARLTHANTVQVFDSGVLDDGSLYLAMEYLPGRDLAWHLRVRGPMTEEAAITIGVQVLGSLEEAHAKGVIHRDIKPANIMLVRRQGADDRVKLLDFGVAKLQEAEGKKSQTGEGEFIGTPSYMAPEQALGEPPDPRTDLYALGAVLFELVAGRPVFIATSPMAVVTHHLATPPPRLAEVAPTHPVSAAFEAVLRKALEKDRTLRFASADAMRAALERVRREQGGLPTDFTPMPEELGHRLASRDDFDRFERSLRLKRVLAPVAALLVVGLVALGALVGAVRQGGPSAVEVEPNDEPNQATPIPLGVAVSGSMGARTDPATGDRDLFMAEVPAGPTSVQLTGVADLNLKLELLQLQAGKLTRKVFLDDQGPGAGERVDGLELSPGPLYVRVEEGAWFGEPPRAARERTLMRYQLTVQPMQVEGPHEVEPNDAPEQAQLCPWTRSVLAWTGGRWGFPGPDPRPRPTPSAVDWFEVTAPDADTVAVVVVPPEGTRLLLLDGAHPEAWAKSAPRPVVADGVPVLLRLGPGGGARRVRIHAEG